MNTLEVIAARRSIRAFKDIPINKDLIQTILTAAIQAPSSKNRQPWRFIVVSAKKRAEMVRIFRQEIAYWKARGRDLGSCEQTASVIEQAPVTILVLYPDLVQQRSPYSVDQISRISVDIQAIGASIQNMLLAAQHSGLGSLWIADICLASEKLCNWLGEDSALVAAVSLGYASESPKPRPRKQIDEVFREL
jgi:nitroreductase